MPPKKRPAASGLAGGAKKVPAAAVVGRIEAPVQQPWVPEDGLFTEHLRVCSSDWEAARNHPMTDAIAAGEVTRPNGAPISSKDSKLVCLGSVPLPTMRKYLIQDHKFIDAFVVLLSSMIAHAPTLEDRIPGAQFLGLITDKENTYFERSFTALGVTAEERSGEPLEVTAQFLELMRSAAASGSCAQMLAVLIAAEWSYLAWAERVEPGRKPDIPFWCGEWIDLHHGEGFQGVVAYLRGLLDNAAPSLPMEELVAARGNFLLAMQLEKRFWDMAWSVA